MDGMEAQIGQVGQQQKTLESQIRQLAFDIENLQEEDGEEDEKEEEGPSEDKSEDENFIIKRYQEECPLMDTSTKEQESQEASKEELKIKMSISQPLNSSICIFFDNNASIDFILPLDSFDHKKEVEKILGILEKKGSEWKEMLKNLIEKKLCTNDMGNRSTSHGRLVDEESQRLRYNGKEDRYPWLFR
ncbi:hypothetical protein ACS0TY_024191 [Phlomoides rotata]